MEDALKSYLSETIAQVDTHLDALLPREEVAPAKIHEAMRYSVFAGGKRLRPVLCMAACESVGGEAKLALTPACATEILHTYSLIHDDLPCMDDDDYRRGRLTNHKVFGEAVAVLAGDALLNESFRWLADFQPQETRFSAIDFVKSLAEAGGSRALIGGQVMDMEHEGLGNSVSYEALVATHKGKTGALLTSAIEMGGMAGNATDAEMKALRVFGENLGLAFQVIDDILDVTQSSEALGKTAGKDEAVNKATYPALLGVEGAQAVAAELTEKALSAVAELANSSRLVMLAEYLLRRQS